MKLVKAYRDYQKNQRKNMQFEKVQGDPFESKQSNSQEVAPTNFKQMAFNQKRSGHLVEIGWKISRKAPTNFKWMVLVGKSDSSGTSVQQSRCIYFRLECIYVLPYPCTTPGTLDYRVSCHPQMSKAQTPETPPMNAGSSRLGCIMRIACIGLKRIDHCKFTQATPRRKLTARR